MIQYVETFLIDLVESHSDGEKPFQVEASFAVDFVVPGGAEDQEIVVP